MNYRSRSGKIWASFKAWWMVVREPPRLRVRIRADDRKFKRRTAAVLVSNNPLGSGHLPYPDDPRQGTLGLYVVKSRRVPDLLKLAARIVLGKISTSPNLDYWLAREIDIVLPSAAVSASVDGEIVSLATPLRCRLHRGALYVLKPRSAGQQESDLPVASQSRQAQPSMELAPHARVAKSKQKRSAAA